MDITKKTTIQGYRSSEVIEKVLAVLGLAKTEMGNNVKPQFSVRHICYFSWLLSDNDINKISSALLKCVSEGTIYSEPLKDGNLFIEWKDISNLPPRRVIG